jgi:hypothetical protein
VSNSVKVWPQSDKQTPFPARANQGTRRRAYEDVADIWTTTTRLTTNSVKVHNGVLVPTSVMWSHFKIVI